MHDTGCSELVRWDDPEGWDGMGRVVGGWFRIGNTCTLMADSCQCMAKTTAILAFLTNTMDNYGSVNVRFLVTVG